MKKKNFETYRPLPERRLPIIIHMPHAGGRVPGDLLATFCASEDEIRAMDRQMRDQYVIHLFWSALHYGATVFYNMVSRLVYDPERFEDDAIERMARYGLGMVYTKQLDGSDLRRPDPSGLVRNDIIKNFHRPYVAAMEALIAEYLEEFGEVWILDAHSYPNKLLPFMDRGAPKPVACLGTNSDHEAALAPALAWFRHNEEWLLPFQPDGAERAIDFNTPFGGSYVPPRYIDDPRVHSLMIEVNRSACETPSAARSAGGPHLGDTMAKFLGWFTAYVARQTGVERGPMNKLHIAGIAARAVIESGFDAYCMPGDLVDGRRCRIDADHAVDIDLDIDHLADCWVCRVVADDPSHLGTPRYPVHMFIDKWTSTLR